MLKRMSVRRAATWGVLAAGCVGAAAAAQSAPVDYRTPVAGPAKPCASLEGLERADTTILWATARPATETLPAHCEVRGVIAPKVNFRIQMPDAWNGRFYMAGNGGLAGEPVDGRTGPGGDPTAEALRRGFAAAITDTGHDRREVADASFAADRQLLIDYAYRAVHETVLVGKMLVADYYGRPEAASYWEGCSTGGRQGLISAQRFPEDFDGVVAGAPISDYTGTMIAVFWTTDRVERAALSPAQLDLVADAYDRKCDRLDGLEDGLVSNPGACAFTPSTEVPICPAESPADDCLTSTQAKLLDEIVAGPSAGGTRLHAGLPVATMRATDPTRNPWVPTWLAAEPGQSPMNLGIHGPTGSMAYMVYDPPRPGFDWRAFDFEKDPALLGELSEIIDATDPNLDAFRAERSGKGWGGKLLMYHGTADAGLVFGMSVDYRDAVVDRYGEATGDFYRLLPMPGMYHCRGGYGPDRADFLDAIVNWVEGGEPPEGLVARQLAEGEVVRERPLCDYPGYARYEGGDPAKAESFGCAKP